jgi:hypothetical protein
LVLSVNRAPSNSRSTILIVSTCWWAFPSRLAMAFAAIGHRIEVVCPRHHPLGVTNAVHARYHYSALNPLAALKKAIVRAEPALVVPCDDRAVGHLQALHAATQSDAPAIARILERSLGNTVSFAVVAHRAELIATARAEGIAAPEMRRVANAKELDAAIDALGLPIILKTDGTWGGLGVQLAETREEAAAILKAFSRPVSALRTLKRLLVDRDPYWIPACLKGLKPTVNVQRFVEGTPANSAVACWNGEVLATICVAAVRTRGPRGASTIVRVIDNPEMTAAGAKLVRRLGLSGLCGFDFVLDDETGTAHLVEMNARSTPISHLPLGEGRNLVAALAKHLDGVPSLGPSCALTQDLIAFFPQAWLLEPQSELLHAAHHDVPWSEQALVRELTKLPWEERGLLARLARRLRRTDRAAAVAAGPTHYSRSMVVDLTSRS